VYTDKTHSRMDAIDRLVKMYQRRNGGKQYIKKRKKKDRSNGDKVDE
jgi:hypothetical protein